MLLQTPSCRMVRGHLSPRFLPFGISSRRLRNEIVRGPRNNGFSGPAVALDGPAHFQVMFFFTLYRKMKKKFITTMPMCPHLWIVVNYLRVVKAYTNRVRRRSKPLFRVDHWYRAVLTRQCVNVIVSY